MFRDDADAYGVDLARTAGRPLVVRFLARDRVDQIFIRGRSKVPLVSSGTLLTTENSPAACSDSKVEGWRQAADWRISGSDSFMRGEKRTTTRPSHAEQHAQHAKVGEER